MWLARDLELHWNNSTLPVRVVRGVRQSGKSSLLAKLANDGRPHLTFDDLRLRTMAQLDPALFFDTHPGPLILDEVQYVPNLFPEIKLRVDRTRRARALERESAPDVSLWLTGSNQILMDAQVRESLAGRAHTTTLHTLSIGELRRGLPDFQLKDAFIRGGWPELYVSPTLAPASYLNDYLRSFVEKDIVSSAGIQKTFAFTQALGLLSARTGQLLNATEVAQSCGVESTTIGDWLGLLERNLLIQRLRPFFDNLNKRLLKTPKLYFLDVGLAARLQGWSDVTPLLQSPQAGHLFETLVFGEIVRTRDHHERDWSLFYWRTKEGDEVDFVIGSARGDYIALDAKLAVQGVSAETLPRAFSRTFPDVKKLGLVTFAGRRQMLSASCEQVPLPELATYLLEHLG